MKLKQGLFTVGVMAILAQSGFATEQNLESAKANQEETDRQNASAEEALGEFEKFAEMMGEMGVRIEQQQESDHLTHKIQQRDVDCRLSEGAPGCAQEISHNTDIANYIKAVEDPYYGYQIFIVVDKSKSNGRTIQRNGNQRQPQTMYVYRRNGDQIQLVLTAPVSTGRELTPGRHDTREGYMRVQSAQRGYRSVTYGEAMPHSLWFESEYGTAIHQTRADWCANQIGTRASAGCIRLCADVAPGIFDLVTSYGSTADRYRSERLIGVHPIVLLHKRNGAPVASGGINNSGVFDVRTAQISNGRVIDAPKVIKGFPAFVRVIDTKDRNGNEIPEKVQELENIIKNPAQGLKIYFKPVSKSAYGI